MSPRVAYSLFMLLALLAFLVVRHFMPKPAALRTLPLGQRLVLVLAGFCGGALGAKVPFLFHGEGLFSQTTWLSDGKTITTGLLGAYVAVEIAKLILGVTVKTGDTFALPLAVALCIGRWGCFCNGCCGGVATDWPWGVDFGDGVARHPTQIYESAFHLAMAALLVGIMRRGWFRYHRLKLYLIAYGGYRFFTEYIRPEPASALGLTFYQWVAIVMIVGLSAQWIVDRRRLGSFAAPDNEPIPDLSRAASTDLVKTPL